jgi:hypothetical protein
LTTVSSWLFEGGAPASNLAWAEAELDDMNIGGKAPQKTSAHRASATICAELNMLHRS